MLPKDQEYVAEHLVCLLTMWVCFAKRTGLCGWTFHLLTLYLCLQIRHVSCVAWWPGVCGGAPHLLTLYLCVQMKSVSLCCQSSVDIASVCEFVLPKDQECVVEYLMCCYCISVWVCVTKGPGVCGRVPHVLLLHQCVSLRCQRTRSVW